MASPVVEHKRDKWSHKVEFMLAQLGWAVGYGNVWRFPYMCYKYGGAAFLIPYVCALLFAGVPVYAIELTLGQYSSLGINKVFRNISPVFHGIGWGVIVVSLIVMIYFNMLISWSIYYFVASFQPLPWTTCVGEWNKEFCFSNLEDQRCRDELKDPGAMFYHGQCYNSSMVEKDDINGTMTNLRNKTRLIPTDQQIQECQTNLTDHLATWYNNACYNATAAVGKNNTIEFLRNTTLTTPADDYFFSGMLHQTDGFHDMGELHWELVLCQVASWTLVFCCIFQGIKTSGKVVYFTATFPYILLTILLIRGLTLDGAMDGIRFYIVPNVTKLASVEIWKAAAVQIFYTYGIAFGVVVTFASYNQFKSNVLRDAFVVCCTDSLTSFYTGFAIFSTAGFIAKQLGRNVDEIIQQGTGLAFVVYPEALARMPWSSFWSVTFFFMMILLGLDSQFPMIECSATALMDQFPKLRKYKIFLFLGLCVFGFVMGLPICMGGGLYIFTLINDYSAGWCLILLSLFEVIVAVYVYGFKRLIADVEMMAGKQYKIIWAYWLPCWLVITPCYLFFIFVFSLIDYAPSVVGDYKFPPAAQVCGWITSIASVIMVPIFAIYHIYDNRKKKQPLKKLIEPTKDWCPESERNKMQPTAPYTGSEMHDRGSPEPAYNNPTYTAEMRF